MPPTSIIKVRCPLCQHLKNLCSEDCRDCVDCLTVNGKSICDQLCSCNDHKYDIEVYKFSGLTIEIPEQLEE